MIEIETLDRKPKKQDPKKGLSGKGKQTIKGTGGKQPPIFKKG